MELVAKFKNGAQITLKEIEGLSPNSEVLLMKLKFPLRSEDLEKFEKELTEKIGIKVVLIQPTIDKIYSM